MSHILFLCLCSSEIVNFLPHKEEGIMLQKFRRITFSSRFELVKGKNEGQEGALESPSKREQVTFLRLFKNVMLFDRRVILYSKFDGILIPLDRIQTSPLALPRGYKWTLKSILTVLTTSLVILPWRNKWRGSDKWVSKCALTRAHNFSNDTALRRQTGFYMNSHMWSQLEV